MHGQASTPAPVTAANLAAIEALPSTSLPRPSASLGSVAETQVDKPAPKKRARSPSQESDPGDRVPRVLHGSNLNRAEKNKLRRIVCPKEGTGRLEVPENIFEMWEDAAKGRKTLFNMWAKSGGVKDICFKKTSLSASSATVHDSNSFHFIPH